MFRPGTINNLCFVLLFIITLKYFKCDTSPFIYTNKFNQYDVRFLKDPQVEPFQLSLDYKAEAKKVRSVWFLSPDEVLGWKN